MFSYLRTVEAGFYRGCTNIFIKKQLLASVEFLGKGSQEIAGAMVLSAYVVQILFYKRTAQWILFYFFLLLESFWGVGAFFKKPPQKNRVPLTL